jgi:hypothetical protein
MTFLMAQANFDPPFTCINNLTILKPSYSSYLPAYEDGTDRVFRNVGIQNSDAGELSRKKHTISGVTLICCISEIHSDFNIREFLSQSLFEMGANVVHN